MYFKLYFILKILYLIKIKLTNEMINYITKFANL